ncbi:MAG: hypothetical protein NXH75_17850, partial [Halobacteriovoraceae bacterium]|nr:hypothetical protein [Halobacteriovoraceae bacterium]
MKTLIQKFIQLTSVSLLAMSILTSCGNYEEFKEDPSAPFQGVAGANTLTFKEVSEQVLIPKCVKCHGNYRTYDNVAADLDRIVASVRSNRMPQDGPLSNSEKQVLFSWIFAGAPQGDVVVQPIKPEPTFESLGKTIFADKCIVCHRDGGPAPFALNDRNNMMLYATLFNPFVFDFEFPEESEFVKRLTSDNPVEQMPPARSGLELLTEEEREVVIEWIRR